MKIVSWNVNGLASCIRKGFLRFLADAQPDIVCCQEVKTKCHLNTPGYLAYWNRGESPRDAGTLVLAKREPISYQLGVGNEELDKEGRLLTLEYENYYIIDVYVPSLNTYSDPGRSEYRNKWEQALREYVVELQKPVILCGDFNVARTSIDTYPKEQEDEQESLLFEPEIRENFERLTSLGFTDVFRAFYPDVTGAYTWWGPKNRNRAENRGTRLDYFLVSDSLLPCVQSIKFNVDTLGSDHCPISMIISPPVHKPQLDDRDLAAMWRSIAWNMVTDDVFNMQVDIAKAAFYKRWDQVEELQEILVRSWAARVISVKAVAKNDSAPGIDGVKWKTDAEKARAAMSLNPDNYESLPYRRIEIKEKEKTLSIDVPVAYDKAMQYLWHLALDPVAEATADRRSFFCRRGRSLHDLHAYLEWDIEKNPELNLFQIVDVKSFYKEAIHKWFLNNIPMNKVVLKQFLNAGVVTKGDLFYRSAGITYGSSLSPNLANMMLDGLQSAVYDGLYKGGHDYGSGTMTRWADDIIFSIRNEELDVVERILGRGRSVKNLMYIHRQCSYDTLTKIDNSEDALDFYSIVEDFVTVAPVSKSPYLELTEFFRLENKTPFSLTFQQIEKIIGDALPWEARLFKAFWYDDIPGYSSLMWEEENFPTGAVNPTPRDYCICNSWTSQGYVIKALHMNEQRIVFRRTMKYKSGLTIPKELMSQKLPDEAIYECKAFFRHIMDKYGL